jgi:hypothetical protein
VDHVQQKAGTDRGVPLPINGALDLGYVREHVRAFLSGVEEPLVADAVLVAVMLAGDACRYGIPPVTLRLRRAADGAALRIEVDDQRNGAPDLPDDYRTGILDRISNARGLENNGGTTTWAEVALK